MSRIGAETESFRAVWAARIDGTQRTQKAFIQSAGDVVAVPILAQRSFTVMPRATAAQGLVQTPYTPSGRPSGVSPRTRRSATHVRVRPAQFSRRDESSLLTSSAPIASATYIVVV